MTREEVNNLLSILQAFAEGRVIQYKDQGVWKDITTEEGFYTENAFVNVNDYRIKSSPKYRPFVNKEECWNEMLKHQPFGWIKNKEDGHYALLTSVDNGDLCAINGYKGWNFNGIRECFTFADGATFGVKVEEK